MARKQRVNRKKAAKEASVPSKVFLDIHGKNIGSKDISIPLDGNVFVDKPLIVESQLITPDSYCEVSNPIKEHIIVTPETIIKQNDVKPQVLQNTTDFVKNKVEVLGGKEIAETEAQDYEDWLDSIIEDSEEVNTEISHVEVNNKIKSPAADYIEMALEKVEQDHEVEDYEQWLESIIENSDEVNVKEELTINANVEVEKALEAKDYEQWLESIIENSDEVNNETNEETKSVIKELEATVEKDHEEEDYEQWLESLVENSEEVNNETNEVKRVVKIELDSMIDVLEVTQTHKKTEVKELSSLKANHIKERSFVINDLIKLWEKKSILKTSYTIVTKSISITERTFPFSNLRSFWAN